MAPAIVVANILWARAEFAVRHPEKVSWETPSVSQTLVDSYVGWIFALWMLPTAFLLIYAVYRVGQLHLSFLSSASVRVQGGLLGEWPIIPTLFLLQIVAAVGMILLSQYTSNMSVTLHLAGSYMLFLGHAMSIPMSGYICYRLQRVDGERPACLNPKMNAARIVLSAMILLGSLVYFLVYIVRNDPLPVPATVVHSFFVNFEVVLLVMFVTYLASFVFELFHYECARRAGILRDGKIFSRNR